MPAAKPQQPSALRLRWVLFLSAGFLLVELLGGIAANSLALLSDAGHMLSDVTALALALIAVTQMRRPPDVRRSFGYRRLEVVAALANGTLLCAVAVVVGLQAYRRIQNPPEVRGGLLLIVAVLGLFVNLVGLMLLREDSRRNMGVRGASLHIAGDTLGSLGAIVAGIVITATGWTKADALVSFLIALLILVSGAGLVRESLHILMEGVPRHIQLPEVERSLRGLEGVSDIHDLHVWRIGSDFDTLTVHVVLERVEDWRIRRNSVRTMLRARFGIEHCTIQVEELGEEPDTGCRGPICERNDA